MILIVMILLSEKFEYIAIMEPDCKTYLEKYFPRSSGVGVRRPNGRKFRRMSGLSEKPRVVVGHSFVERMAKNEKVEEDDKLVVGWISHSGATMEQVLTAVYHLLDGEFRHLEAEIVVCAWENSVMNGMTEKEAEVLLEGLVAEQQNDLPHRIFVAECAMSPALIKEGKSAVVYRINKLVKAANKRLGAHCLDFEKSVGKVVARRDLVGLKRGMWAGEGRAAYHPNDVGASRMASWMREFLRHGTNIMDPDYPPRGFRKRETVGPDPVKKMPATPTVNVPPYWGRTKEKEERTARARQSRRQERSEPPQRRERVRSATRARSSSVESACRMDSEEERTVDDRALIVVESDDGGARETRVVRDLISLEEDPREGPSSGTGGSVLDEALSTPLPATQGSLDSSPEESPVDEGKKRKRDGILEDDEEGLEALDAQWRAGMTIMQSLFKAKKRAIQARDGTTAARARKEMARKREMLSKHMAGLEKLVMQATELSDDESSSSSSSSSSDSEVHEVEKVTRKLKSVREASSRPMRK